MDWQIKLDEHFIVRLQKYSFGSIPIKRAVKAAYFSQYKRCMPCFYWMGADLLVRHKVERQPGLQEMSGKFYFREGSYRGISGTLYGRKK